MNEVSPFTWTRRSGAACDTAQNSVLPWHPCSPMGLIVRLDSDRQKLSSAMQFVVFGSPVGKHWLKTSTEPLITTSLGDAPSPATWV